MKKNIVLVITAMIILTFAGCTKIKETESGQAEIIASTPSIGNGDFSLGAQWEHEGWTASKVDWDNTWITFSIEEDQGRKFVARTKDGATLFLPTSIEQSITLPVGTYAISSKIFWSWDTNAGDTVKIEVLDGSSVLASGIADITNTGEQDFTTGNFAVTDEKPVTIKITFTVTAANAGTAIDDVTLVKVLTSAQDK